MWKEFKEFAVKGSVIDLAVGIIIGTSFNGIVSSLVNDIVMPPLGLLIKRVDFSNLYINLSSKHYASLAAAKAAGAPTINYGTFVNTLINFIIVAFAVFLLVKQINRLKRQPPAPEPNTKICQFCKTEIAKDASRCPACTSQLNPAA